VHSPCVPHPPAGPSSELRWCQGEREHICFCCYSKRIWRKKGGGREKKKGERGGGKELSETGVLRKLLGGSSLWKTTPLDNKPRPFSLHWMWREGNSLIFVFSLQFWGRNCLATNSYVTESWQLSLKINYFLLLFVLLQFATSVIPISSFDKLM